ncbi:nuclear transport factor 2 family protein [Actinomadura nitritigenes]|uniref:nuclear transport factor 2 family protein n=1 Tax=Actinomadura nitritigenes TaxID=134602 RepID=UPI003D8B46C0
MSQLVRDYIELVWNQGRTGEADRFLAENLIQHNPNLPDGRKPLVDFIGGLREQLPLARFGIRRVAAEGDLIFVHSLFTAHPEDRGTAVVDIFRIEDGLIAEHWDLREDVPETTVSGHGIV